MRPLLTSEACDGQRSNRSGCSVSGISGACVLRLTYYVAAPLAGGQDQVAACKRHQGCTPIGAALRSTGPVCGVHLGPPAK
jgi:hypothetical protein